MSALEHYLNRGYTPINKLQIVQEGAAVAVWSPSTSTKVVVTNIGVSGNSATTIAFYWGSVGGTKIAEFVVSGSATIHPSIGAWDANVYDRSLFAVVKVGQTDGARVNLTGFEIPFI